MRVVPVNERLHFMFTNVRKRSPLLMHLTMLDSNLKMLLRARIQFSGNRSMNLCSMCLVAVNKHHIITLLIFTNISNNHSFSGHDNTVP